MKKSILSVLLGLISLTVFGQVADINRQTKTPLSGGSAGNQAVRDYNLTAIKNLRIPVGTSFSIAGAKDSIGYVMFNTSIQRMGVYKGGGSWDTLSTSTASLYLAGYGLLKTGNTFRVDTSGVGGIASKPWVNGRLTSYYDKTASDGRFVTKVNNYSELVSAISAGNKNIWLNQGTYTFTSAISLPSGIKISGSKSALLKAGTGVNLLFNIVGVSDVTLEGFYMEGLGALVDKYSSSIISTASQLNTLTNIGASKGVYVKQVSRVTMNDLYFNKFSSFALEVDTIRFTGSPLETGFLQGLSVTNTHFENSYMGVRFNPSADYSRLTNITALRNVCGISILSGNITVSNSMITDNRVGFHFGAGGNNGHGTVAGSTVNHNALRSIYVKDLNFGEQFIGTHVFDGDIELDNSAGFNFNGGTVACVVINNSNVGNKNVISNSTFISSGGYGSGTITNLGTEPLVLHNNHFQDGSPETALNNYYLPLTGNSQINGDIDLRGTLKASTGQYTGEMRFGYDPTFYGEFKFSALTGLYSFNNKSGAGSPTKYFSFLADGVEKAFIKSDGEVNAFSYVKTGGTSSQFLKADGSVDATTYATDANVLHKTGNESATGIKTLADLTVTNTANFPAGIISNSDIVLENPSTFANIRLLRTNATGTNNIKFQNKSYTLADSADVAALLTSNVIVVSGTSATAVSGKVYQTTNGSMTTVTLPSSASNGTTVVINGIGAGKWRLQQGNAGDLIKGVGGFTTVAGATHGIETSDQYGTVSVRYYSAGGIWLITSQNGSVAAY